MFIQIKNVVNDECIDVNATATVPFPTLYPCTASGENQFIGLAKTGQLITTKELCISQEDFTINLVKCSDSDRNQLWDYHHEVCTE